MFKPFAYIAVAVTVAAGAWVARRDEPGSVKTVDIGVRTDLKGAETDGDAAVGVPDAEARPGDENLPPLWKGDLDGDGVISLEEISKQSDTLVPVAGRDGELAGFARASDVYGTAEVSGDIPLYDRAGKEVVGRFPVSPTEIAEEPGEVTLDGDGRVVPIDERKPTA